MVDIRASVKINGIVSISLEIVLTFEAQEMMKTFILFLEILPIILYFRHRIIMAFSSACVHHVCESDNMQE